MFLRTLVKFSCVFFFFKQKTAYEMRISDWSSDVCSSDLFAGLARRFDVIGTSAGGITVIDDFGHNPEKCAATLRTLKSSPGRVIEIGRASCRERVCQYV